MADEGNIVRFEDAVKAKLKDTIAELIPEEKWDRLVMVVTNEFLEKDLRKMVEDELRRKYTEAIKNELDSPEWREKWDNKNGVQGASEIVKRIAAEAAPIIFEQVIAQAIQNQIYNIRQQLGR